MFSYAKKGKRGVGALILSHETLHMEAIGNTVVLPCRVSGRPRPEVTWLDPEGKPVLVGKKFQVRSRPLPIHSFQCNDNLTLPHFLINFADSQR